jgi:hypothetical protein
VKKTALAIAAQFGVGIAIDFAEAMGGSRSEAEIGAAGLIRYKRRDYN